MTERVGVVGAGYVGLTTAACLAHLGHAVRCVDNDAARVTRLAAGTIDIREPDLPRLVHDGLRSGRLRFAAEPAAVADCAVLILCLPTPSGRGGAPDVGTVMSVAESAARVVTRPCALVVKSTVPPGTAGRLQERVGAGGVDVDVVSNPEFLREGHCVADFLRPDRIVLGGRDDAAVDAVARLYGSVPAPIVRTDWASAELAKYACNGFLALKASFTNELADLCDAVGADVREVTAVMAGDPRIGERFLAPGPGWGGSCLPKDTRGLLDTARRAGTDVDTVQAAVRSNGRHRHRLVRRIVEELTGRPGGSLDGHRIGVLGLTFKAGTDDTRESPAVAVANELCRLGATVSAYDPACGSRRADVVAGGAEFRVVDDPVLAAKGASAILVLTEWPDFRSIDWRAVAREVDRRLVVDARNVLDAAELTDRGFSYLGMGRS